MRGGIFAPRHKGKARDSREPQKESTLGRDDEKKRREDVIIMNLKLYIFDVHEYEYLQ